MQSLFDLFYNSLKNNKESNMNILVEIILWGKTDSYDIFICAIFKLRYVWLKAKFTMVRRDIIVKVQINEALNKMSTHFRVRKVGKVELVRKYYGFVKGDGSYAY